MREIKFRVWDNVDCMSGSITLQDLQDGRIQFTSDCPVMQFTGLHDENGKEIYEGDILVTPKGICAVTYELGCFYTIIESRYRLGGWGGIIEVIGNVYETPGLIDRG